MDKKTLGKKGETLSAIFLMLKGYKIIKRNYRTRNFEIDIIAKKGDTYIFAEVKTRSSDTFSKAVEAVDVFKQKKIITGAMYFMSGCPDDATIRFDIIEVYRNKKSMLFPYRINHIINAFDAH